MEGTVERNVPQSLPNLRKYCNNSSHSRAVDTVPLKRKLCAPTNGPTTVQVSLVSSMLSRRALYDLTEEMI